jgi:hypothetical protein
MKKPHLKALVGGLVIILIAMPLWLRPETLQQFIAFVPGAAFGIFLIAINKWQVPFWKRILFLLISEAIYVGCFITIKIFDAEDVRLIASLEMILTSCLGWVLLSIAYQFFILKTWSLKRLMRGILFVGICSAIPTAIALYFVNEKDVNDLGHGHISIFWVSVMFIILPLWQYGFVRVWGTKTYNPVSQKTATDI